MQTEDKVSNQAIRLVLGMYFAQMRKAWRYLVPALLLPGVGNILVFYVPPLVVAALVSAYNQGQPVNLLWYATLFGGAWILGELCWRAVFQLMVHSSKRGLNNLYNQALDELVHKDLAFFSDNFAGSITKRAISFARNYEMFCDKIIFQIAPAFMTLLFVSVILWRYSPWYIALLLGGITLVIAVIVPLIRRRSVMVVERTAASTRLAGHIADVVGNISAVKAFAREDKEMHTHGRLTTDFIKKATRSWNYHNMRISMAISPIYVLVNVLALLLAVHLTTHGQADISVLVVSLAVVGQFTRVFWDFNPIYREMESLITEAGEFGEYLLKPPAIANPPHPLPFKVTQGGISFDRVSFDYKQTEGDTVSKRLFQDFSLSIKPGERVGLVGPSGGGKTTISKLVLRFMDIQDGTITIDGQNIAEVAQRDLRAAIAYVPQDPAMFHRSLRENIRYGRLDATDKEVLAAARAAHADEFVSKLSHGYETMVGERGVKLSGGQRQRVAIARAILRDAPILILDEATSALDSESEKLIQDALWNLMKGKTAIVIAHRLSTIQKMDRIIVLDHGQIVEQGSHQELLAHKGIYANLWTHQSGGFLE